MEKIKKFNENNENQEIISNFRKFDQMMEKKNQNTIKKYVIKYDDYHYYVDDVIGDTLVKDIKYAKIFSEKLLKYFGGIEALKDITELYCEDCDEMISITHPFELIEI